MTHSTQNKSIHLNLHSTVLMKLLTSATFINQQNKPKHQWGISLTREGPCGPQPPLTGPPSGPWGPLWGPLWPSAPPLGPWCWGPLWPSAPRGPPRGAEGKVTFIEVTFIELISKTTLTFFIHFKLTVTVFQYSILTKYILSIAFQ